MTTLNALPDSFPAGTTVEYTLSPPDYPASAGWTLKLALAGPSQLSKNATASGDDFLVALSAGSTETGGLLPGLYRWSHQVSLAGKVYEVGSGTVVVTANPALATGNSQQSHNEKMLAGLNAILEAMVGAGGAVPKDIEAYVMDTLQVTKVSRELLIQLRMQYAYAVARDRNGGGFGRQHHVAFTGTRNE